MTTWLSLFPLERPPRRAEKYQAKIWQKSKLLHYNTHIWECVVGAVRAFVVGAVVVVATNSCLTIANCQIRRHYYRLKRQTLQYLASSYNTQN